MDSNSRALHNFTRMLQEVEVGGVMEEEDRPQQVVVSTLMAPPVVEVQQEVTSQGQ
jgi:hypothetical protein